MHYAFDMWIERTFPDNPWCRYADDGIVHCQTKEQAQEILEKLADRMNECKLEIHEGKTQIIYCKDDNRKEISEINHFTFLGYTFRPRKAKTKMGGSFTSFLPAISDKGKQHIKTTMKSWYLLHQVEISLDEISDKYNSAIRGWINYYGLFGRAELYKVLYHLNHHLTLWVMRKFKRYKRKKKRAIEYLQRIAVARQNLFAHWSIGILPKTG